MRVFNRKFKKYDKLVDSIMKACIAYYKESGHHPDTLQLRQHEYDVLNINKTNGTHFYGMKIEITCKHEEESEITTFDDLCEGIKVFKCNECGRERKERIG